MEEIRAKRIARRSIPGKSCKSKNSGDDENGGDDSRDNDGYVECITKDTIETDKLLNKLKNDEPTSDNIFFRLSIISSEIGDIHKAIVYAERFRDDEKISASHLANGKLAMADALTQLYLLCISLDWDFHKLRRLGVQHLEERHEDFKWKGWRKIK